MAQKADNTGKLIFDIGKMGYNEEQIDEIKAALKDRLVETIGELSGPVEYSLRELGAGVEGFELI